tara:strand:- start:1924 stop:2295 length:372 start_codon:yes stop_codon:yes gene_type:complete
MNYILGLTLTGIITGIFGGFVGGGAEILIVPLLTFFGILGSLKSRIATSLFMLLPPIGIFAAMSLHKHGFGDIKAGMYMAFLFTIASFFSAKLSIKTNTDLLRQIFGIFTIISGLYIFFNKES